MLTVLRQCSDSAQTARKGATICQNHPNRHILLWRCPQPPEKAPQSAKTTQSGHILLWLCPQSPCFDPTFPLQRGRTAIDISAIRMTTRSPDATKIIDPNYSRCTLTGLLAAVFGEIGRPLHPKRTSCSNCGEISLPLHPKRTFGSSFWRETVCRSTLDGLLAPLFCNAEAGKNLGKNHT